MKKFILLTAIIFSFLAVNAQKTTGGNYTYIAQRYEWLAGVFKALGLPAGAGPAAFTTGQEMRAGAIYYDSSGVDAGLYIFNGISWGLIGGGSQNLQQVTDLDSVTNHQMLFSRTSDAAVVGRISNNLGIGQAEFIDPDNGSSAVLSGDGTLTMYNTGGFGGRVSVNLLTGNRFYELPDADGTIALLSQVPSAISMTNIGTSGNATYNPVTGVINVPDYSSGTSIWNGTVIGTTFSATSTTINNGAVQWTFTGSSPATFTLPARTSSVNQFYTIKNIGSADLTVAAAGTDDIYTTSAVSSITVLPGGSVMITGAANGTSDLWTALFTGSSDAILDIDSLGSAGISPITTWNNVLYGRRISISGGSIDTTASGGLLITVPGGSAQNLSYDATNHEVDISDGGTSAVIPLALADGATEGLASFTANDFDITSGNVSIDYANGQAASGTVNGFMTTTTQTFAGGKTFTGGITFSGIVTASSNLTVGGQFYMGSTAANSNIWIPSPNASSTTSQAEYQLDGSSFINFRTGFRGSSSMGVTANNSAANVIIGGMTMGEAATGNHPLLTGLAVKTPTVTAAAGTVTNAATLTVEGAPTVTVSGRSDAVRIASGNTYLGNGSLTLGTAGNKLNIATGSNASVGTSAAMTAGSITISTTAVTASSIIMLVHASLGGTQGILSVGTITAGTSFVINSSSATDTGTVNWWIIN